MRNALIVLAAFSISSILGGCHSNSSTPPAVNPGSGDHPPAVEPAPVNPWTLKLQSRCEATAEDRCIANFGFSVSHDGHFQIGPGPQGEVKTGTLSAEDMNTLTSVLNPTLNAPRVDAIGQQPIEPGESDDTVTLVRGTGNADVLLKTTGPQLNYQVQSPDVAKNLLAVIRSLAAKYYALPFPFPCGDSAAALTTLYSSIQSCATDQDCAYIDGSFDIVDASASGSLTTDDCSVVKRLYVANATAVKTNKTKLIDAWTQLGAVCGDDIMRADCQGITQIELRGQPPVCRQGVCQAHPNS